MHSLHNHIRKVNWSTFDLNLLIVFDAIMQERSVTRAGQRIGLSQPAMSHALNRLRYMLKDELFIRTPEGMMPTPRAEQIAPPLRHALSEMQLALELEAFVPEESDRHFSIAVNNYAAVVLAPLLVAAVAAAAPSVRLNLRPSGTLDIVNLLDRGELDLAIGGFDDQAERFAREPILEDPFVIVMRRHHAAERRELSAEDIAALPHLDISSTGDDTGFIDQWLARNGLTRRIALQAPFISAGKLLAQTDMIAAVNRRIAQEIASSNALSIRELPFASPTVRTTMAWHRRLENHPAHRWLRDIVRSSCKAGGNFDSASID